MARFWNSCSRTFNALRHIATVGSIGSSTRIEGNKLTDREIEKILLNLEIKSFKSCDEQEVIDYANFVRK
ncbi:hypothetical protein [Bartonella sp. AA74HLJMH]|uniref:hypothetical protein n=1 Tax=Bartonella sp. AA74HLJMH TaxID=3243436 RepID=UPI0035CF62DF